MKTKEFERKFIIKEIPIEVNYTKVELIRQGYLATDDMGEVRIRGCDNKEFFITYKTTGTDVRYEEEHQIPQNVFDGFWQYAMKRAVIKSRLHGYFDGNAKSLSFRDVTIDEYLGGKHHGLLILEIEFSTEESMNMFDPGHYDYIEEEVTDDPTYKNRNMAEDITKT